MASATITSGNIEAVHAGTNLVGGLVKSITWRIDEKPNIAEITLPRKRIQEFREYSAGKPVYVKIYKNGVAATVFQGWLTGRYFEFAGNNENVAAICLGPRWRLNSDFVKGRYMYTKNEDYQYLTGPDCIFNEKLSIDGTVTTMGNGTLEKDEATGIRPFSPDVKNVLSVEYNTNDMLWYAYKSKERLSPDVVGDCLSMTEHGIGSMGEIYPQNVNIDGMQIGDAMDYIMRVSGLRWWCKPISTQQSEVKAVISSNVDAENSDISDTVGIVSNDRSKKYFYLASIGTGVDSIATANIASSINNVESGKVHEDYAQLSNEVYGFGAAKLYQEQFLLWPDWNADDEAALRLEFANNPAGFRAAITEATSTDWEKYKDIGRRWVLDETGEITDNAHDFEELFGSKNYAERLRAFLAMRVDDTPVELIEVYNPLLGETWQKYNGIIDVLTDQAGIYISSTDITTPPLLVEGTYATSEYMHFAEGVRITLPVRGDESLEKSATADSDDQPNYNWGRIRNSSDDLTRRRALLFGDEYQIDNINDSSSIEARLQEITDRKHNEYKNHKVSAGFSVPWVTWSYEPGDIVYGVKGRNIYFQAIVSEVRMELQKNQRTEVILEDVRMAFS